MQSVFEHLSTTASAFIVQARLQKAAERLTADRKGSVTALAFDCGFSDSAYFSRCFRHYFGVSPREYRLQGHTASAPRRGAALAEPEPDE